MPTLRESGLGFLQAQALWNNTNTTVANSTQISTNGTAANSTQILKTVQITAADSKAPTDGNSVNIDLQIQPFPVTTGIDTQFKITFLQATTQSVQVHVDWNLVISKMDKVVFTTTAMYGQPVQHTAEGIVFPSYEFKEAGEYSIQISIVGVNFQPIKSEQALFNLKVN